MLPLQADGSDSGCLLFDLLGDGIFCWVSVYRETLATSVKQATPETLMSACREACSEESPGPAVGKKYPDLK